MTDPTAQAERLAAKCDATAKILSSRDAKSPELMATIILEHQELRAELRRSLQRELGILDELRRLISMVAELLGTVIATTNGQALWTSELPPGKAPIFRRALNKLVAYIRDAKEPEN